MTRFHALAGCAVLVSGLALVGCGDRMGDLGAEMRDETPMTPIPAETADPTELAALTTPSEPINHNEGDTVSPAGNEDGKAAPAEDDDENPAPVAQAVDLSSPESQPTPVAADAKDTQAKTAGNENAEAKTDEPAEAKAEKSADVVTVTEAPKGLEMAAAPAAPLGAPVSDDGDGKAGGEPPAPAPAPAPEPAPDSPEARAKKLLDEVATRRNVNDQAQDQQADAAFQAGMRLYNDLEYNGALAKFEEAVRINPAHKGAQEYLGKTRALLGVHTDRIAEALRALDQAYRVRIQESLVALANALEEARTYEMRGSEVPLDLETAEREEILAEQLKNLREAQGRYRRVREIMNWMPPQIDLPNERKLVDEAQRRVHAKIIDKQDEISYWRREQAVRQAEASRARENEHFKQRIQVMIEHIGDLYDRGMYAETEHLANSVLQLDPFNSEAETWKRKARSARHQREASDFRKEYREGLVNTWESVAASHIPYSELLVYPPNWDQISKRTERAALGRTKADDQWKKDIMNRLQRKVSFEFEDAPLSDAINFLKSLTDVTMIVDPRVKAGGAEPPVSLRVTDMKLQLALEWILKLADMKYALQDNAIFISKEANLIQDVEMRIYDVTDLTLNIQDFPGPDFQLQTISDDESAGGGAALNPFAAAPAATVTVASIADMIRQRVRPDSWDPQQNTSIEERAGRLVVMQRPEIHALIDQLLANFRAAQRLMVNIESRFLQIREAYLEDIGVEFQGLDPNVLYGDFGDIRNVGGVTGRLGIPRQPGAGDAPGSPNAPFPGITNGPDNLWQGLFSQVGSILNHTINFATNERDTISGRDGGNVIRQSGLSAQVTILNNAQVQAFIRALGIRDNLTTLLAPRLTVFNTQRAHMFVARQQSYIADYEISGDSYDPIVRQFLVGVVLDVRPTVSSDRRYVTLEMRPTVTELAQFQTRQIDSFTINQGAAATVLIPLSFPVQFPELRIQRVRTTATVPDGGILLLGGLYRNVKFNAENGVPFLSDLPVVGRLFRWNVVDNAKFNLAILVSPRIILFNEEEAKL
ncbi:MAG: hypothetical protein L6R28_01225 [Planctomycetes bacterium]|nr:hypothetical protein [Planctomycetota bacterium]